MQSYTICILKDADKMAKSPRKYVEFRAANADNMRKRVLKMLNAHDLIEVYKRDARGNMTLLGTMVMFANDKTAWWELPREGNRIGKSYIVDPRNGKLIGGS